MSVARASSPGWMIAMCVAAAASWACASKPEPSLQPDPPEHSQLVEPDDPGPETAPADDDGLDGEDSEGASNGGGSGGGGGTELDAITKQGLAEIIRAHLPELQTCYEPELTKDGKLSGKLTYTITVERTGAVRKVAVDLDTVSSDVVRQCTIEKIEAWRFEAAQLEDQTDVTFSVDFAAV